MTVIRRVEKRFLNSRTTAMQNDLARVLDGLADNQLSLIYEEHPRWWEYPVGPPTPIPINVQYACDERFGSPRIANCEAALYEFVQSGDLTLDPVSGPIIKVAGRLQDTLSPIQSDAEFGSNNRKLCHSCRCK